MLKLPGLHKPRKYATVSARGNHSVDRESSQPATSAMPVRILLMYDDLMQSCLVPRGVPGSQERGPGQACVLAQTGSAPCALPTGPAWPPVARPSRLHGFKVRVAWVRARFYGRGTLNTNRPDEKHARDDNAVGQHARQSSDMI